MLFLDFRKSVKHDLRDVRILRILFTNSCKIQATKRDIVQSYVLLEQFVIRTMR